MTASRCFMHGADCPTWRAIQEDENERRNLVLDELRKIAYNPEETPARRRKALNALFEETRGSGAAAAHDIRTATVSTPVVGNHRGGFFMATELDYSGVSER